jgi:protein-S-isoprenylcysteine O-methyltransferase Ste14
MSEGFVQRGGGWVAGQLLLLLAVAVLGITGRAAATPLPFELGGLGLLLIAALCGLAGVAALGRNLTPFPRPTARTEFIRCGIYGWIRHPLYTAVICAAAGWSLVWASWPAAAVLPALAVWLDAKARREERWLRQQFPDYADYARRVRRFIPGIY